MGVLFSAMAMGIIPTACATSPSARQIITVQAQDGTYVHIVVPPPDVLQSAKAADLVAKIPGLKSALEGSLSTEEKYIRVRAEVPDLQMFEVLKFHLSWDYVNGLLSKEAYQVHFSNITARFMESATRGTGGAISFSGSQGGEIRTPIPTPTSFSLAPPAPISGVSILAAIATSRTLAGSIRIRGAGMREGTKLNISVRVVDGTKTLATLSIGDRTLRPGQESPDEPFLFSDVNELQDPLPTWTLQLIVVATEPPPPPPPPRQPEPVDVDFVARLLTSPEHARLIRENWDVGSDDGTKVTYSYVLRITNDRRGIEAQITWRVIELEKDGRDRKTVIENSLPFTRVYTVPSSEKRRISRLLVAEKASNSGIVYGGKVRGYQVYPNVGCVSDIRVRFDGRGDDRDQQSMTANVNLRLRLAE